MADGAFDCFDFLAALRVVERRLAMDNLLFPP